MGPGSIGYISFSDFFEKLFTLVCLGGMVFYIGRTCYDARELRWHDSDEESDAIPTIVEGDPHRE